MKKNIWDRYAPVYDRFMQKDYKMYEYMYERIPEVIRGKRVLEVAAGTGLLSRHVASVAKEYLATDSSEGMIRETEKIPAAENVKFELADATALPYGDHSFDVVIISNALHIMEEPEKALQEIDRVLKLNGILIAPNFVQKRKSLTGKFWNRALSLAGISFGHTWGPRQYKEFLARNGWTIEDMKILKSGNPLMYTECRRTVQFRPAAEEDAENVIRFYKDMIHCQIDREFSPDWTEGIYPAEDDLRKEIEAGAMHIGTIRDQIACATVISGNDPIYADVEWPTEYSDDEISVIHLFGVLPEYGGMGLARKMIQYTADVSRKMGRRVIRLDVLKGNDAAEVLYQKNGFRFVTEAQIFYEDTGLTDYEMYERVL